MALAPAASMAEGLTSMLTAIDGVELAPDADPEFIGNLRAMLVSKIRESTAADLTNKASAIGPTSPSPTGPTAMGADMGGALGSPPPADPMASMMPTPTGMGMNATGGPSGVMGAGAPGPGRGISPAPNIPDPDSLRRILNIG